MCACVYVSTRAVVICIHNRSGKISRKIWIDVCINRFPIYTCSSLLSIAIPSFITFRYSHFAPSFSFQTQTSAHITSHHISHSTNDIKRNYTHTLTHLHIKLIHRLNKSNFRQKFMRVSHCFTWIEIFLFQISVTRCENANVCSASKATNIQFNVETKRKKNHMILHRLQTERIHTNTLDMLDCVCVLR